MRTAATSTVRAPIPVICVGNATLGGAGKTPLVQWLAHTLQDARPVIISRGYGRQDTATLPVNPQIHDHTQVGDEPLMLARHHRVIVATRKPAALPHLEDAGVVLLDDGYQNPSLHKDFHILVLDGALGPGNQHIVPRGPLREPFQAAWARADAIAIIGEDQHEILHRLPPKPTLRFSTETRLPPDLNPTQPVLAFCGLAHPQKFFQGLEDAGAVLHEAVPFPDHHPYSHQDIHNLCQRARLNSCSLITTAKDAARLPTRPPPVPIHVAGLHMHLNAQDSDPDILRRLQALCAAPKAAP